MTWIEVHLEVSAKPVDLYRWLGENEMSAASVHHFYDEPWNPKGFVVRLKDLDGDWWKIPECSAVDNVYSWDAVPDEVLYGVCWPYVQQMFHAGSMLGADLPTDFRWHLKLVHCYLNAQGMSERDEARFALRLFFNRLTIRPRLRFYFWKRRHFGKTVAA